MKKFLLITLALISVCGCTTNTKHRGYIFPSDIDNVVETLKTRDDVQQKLGNPSAQTIYGKPLWIYYGYDENYRGPLPLKYDNKQVLLIQFNGEIVTSKKILTDTDLPDDFCMDSDETAVPGAVDLNMFEELFNNIGRFSPSGI